MRWEWIWDCPYDNSGWKAFMVDQPGKVALQTLWERKVEDCCRCNLHKTRQKIVFGSGETERPVFGFVGEAPGNTEDRVGIPFIGAAGKLWVKMLEAMGYTRAQVYVCNVLGCRPPENRDPAPEELQACQGFWSAQLIAVRPRMIIAMGRFAGNALLGESGKTIAEMRKKPHTWHKIPVQVTYHPAALLRDASYKEATWKDLQHAMAVVKQLEIEEARGSGPLFD